VGDGANMWVVLVWVGTLLVSIATAFMSVANAIISTLGWVLPQRCVAETTVAGGTGTLIGDVDSVLTACVVCAVALGLCVHLTTRPRTQMSAKRFFRAEGKDMMLDIVSYCGAVSTGDLEFSNDCGRISTALFTSVCLGLLLFCCELWCHWHEIVDMEPYLPLLTCVHMVVEDSFQLLVYATVALPQVARGAGLPWAVVFGLIQSVLWLYDKMEELGVFRDHDHD
jgi:hypothetical protein